ncbi:MAG: hypothetical protein L6416_02970 [Candidatus Omnitrophica bacterium]|nr:hypothetical protein [Candidatus Omnitrophota bacterium]
MKKKIFNFLSVVIIQSLFLTLCLADSHYFSAQAETLDRDSYASMTMLAPRLFIPQEIVLKALEQKTPLLPLPTDTDLREIPTKEKQSWLQRHFPVFSKLFNRHPLMTVSMEGFHDKYNTQALNANSKGGLGAFFGCLLWGLKKIGVKTVAFQPNFSKRRRQSVKLKHDYVVDHVKTVLANLNNRDFQTSAYRVVEVITQLSEHNNLSMNKFKEKVMAEEELKTGIYGNGRQEAESDIDTGKENIAYVYTAALSVLIDAAINGEKKEAAERAVRKVYRELHINGALSRKIIDKTIEVLQHLSREKQMTRKHFEETIKKEETLVLFFEKLPIKDDLLYDALINCLARTAVTKQQVISEEPVSYDNEPGEYILDQYGNEFTVIVGGLDINDPSKTRYYDVKFKRYVDGSLARIQIVCPELYGLLYQSALTYKHQQRRRFNEDMVSAWAMYAFIKHFPQFRPGMVHFNESPFILLAALMRYDPALGHIPLIYTNHTVVQAGLPKYGGETALIERMFEIMAGGYTIKNDNFSFTMRGDIGEKAFSSMKEAFSHTGVIDLSLAALNIADVSNGVSKEHSVVTKRLFDTTKKIISVLNGSSDYWKNEKLIALEEQKGKENITEEELYDIHNNDGKVRFLKEIEKRTGVKLNANQQVISLIRRITNYKSQYPVLKDIIRVLCADRGTIVRTRWGDLSGLGEQVVIGGFANRGSEQEKWIEEFLRWMNDPDLKGHFVFVPDSDVELLKLQAIGSDICINCPLPFEEACGTSDGRNAENGGLNIVVFDSGGGRNILPLLTGKKAQEAVG